MNICNSWYKLLLVVVLLGLPTVWAGTADGAAVSRDLPGIGAMPSSADTYRLQINTVGGGTVLGPGIRCGRDCSQEVPLDFSIRLIADPDSGWSFSGWGRDCADRSGLQENKLLVCTVFFTASSAYTLESRWWMLSGIVLLAFSGMFYLRYRSMQFG